MKRNLNFVLKVPTLLGILACLMVSGCNSGITDGTLKGSVRSQKDLAATYNQVRLRMRSLVGPMCGDIEQAADQISASNTNASVRRAALLWKIEGVPALRAALFQPDPYLAQFDSWVLCYQMMDYFETGPGKASLGETGPIAVAACRRLEEEMNQVAASMTISGNVKKERAFAQKWAREHPIQYSIAERETALSRILKSDDGAFLFTGQMVAEMTTMVDDLNRRLEIYSDQMFQQARWEAELFKSDFMAELPVGQALPLAERAVKSAEQAVAAVDRLEPAVERAMTVAETAPHLIASEREATLKALHDERVAALKEMHEDMIAERMALTQDIEQISFKVVDHAFWRATQFLVVVLIILVIGLAVALAILKNSRIKKL